ncbi:prolyl 4-hydroxylase [Musa troglodytarum]|uniref:Prolyl 4-hydroxylase n=1 Tax=Musa troglodytarum TaxID=320322 RepID=A0A9E7JNI8_9LILI|nr:prolyl 4-hydroxylase [Musa troglodytarum]
MQILYYEPGEKYGPHFDYFQDQTDRQLGGHRVATVLMYLSNDQNGGETILPQLRGKNATNGHSAEVVLYPHSAICVICRGNYQSQRMTAGQTLQKMAIQRYLKKAMQQQILTVRMEAVLGSKARGDSCEVF